MLNKPLIVIVSASWADAAPGATAIASVRTATHRKSFNCLIGLFLSSRSAIECKRPCSAARRMSGAGRAWPLRRAHAQRVGLPARPQRPVSYRSVVVQDRDRGDAVIDGGAHGVRELHREG